MVHAVRRRRQSGAADGDVQEIDYRRETTTHPARQGDPRKECVTNTDNTGVIHDMAEMVNSDSHGNRRNVPARRAPIHVERHSSSYVGPECKADRDQPD